MRRRNISRRSNDTTNTRQKLILHAITQDKAARKASMYAHGPGSAESILNGDAGLIRVAGHNKQ